MPAGLSHSNYLSIRWVNMDLCKRMIFEVELQQLIAEDFCVFCMNMVRTFCISRGAALSVFKKERSLTVFATSPS